MTTTGNAQIQAAHEVTYEPDSEWPSLLRPTCSCGWSLSGYVRDSLARHFAEQHQGAR